MAREAVPSPKLRDFLGGKDNLQTDRDAAERLLQQLPDAKFGAVINRSFLRLMVRHLAAQAGIRQFLDIGAGLPTVDNTHQVAQRVAPDARVVYVDNDPVVLVHGRALLEGDPGTLVVKGDLCDPWGILENPDVRDHLDFTQPIAVLLIAVMHFVARQGVAREIVQILRRQLPAGSHIVMSHFAAIAGHDVQGAQDVYSETVTPVRARTAAEIADLFEGLELVPPGVDHVRAWLELDEFDVGSVLDEGPLARLPLLCVVGRTG
ncbi:SAM-dependent methyltransferase [Thermopolyspora sp. NPDC052614]|uniref:SAM-dependent methyltransferase n=1 Tax=Thermopolyspora sp. NPDC052614 TaxID=3155682 RepID=UPI003437097A